MPYTTIDSRPFTLADSRRIQAEDIARWELVLKPEVAKEMRERIAANSKGVTKPYDLPRGQEVSSIVIHLSYEAYAKDNIESTLSSGVTFDMPKRAAVDLSIPGRSADSAVNYWRPKLRANLAHLKFEEIMTELVEHGAWEARELLDRPTNEGRLLWLAACQARDNGALD
jgi:hypothetical protein